MPKRRAASRWLSPSTWQAWRTRAYSSTAFILTLPAVRTGRKIRRRLFTPPPRPDTPAASVRDFLSAAYTASRRGHCGKGCRPLCGGNVDACRRASRPPSAAVVAAEECSPGSSRLAAGVASNERLGREMVVAADAELGREQARRLFSRLGTRHGTHAQTAIRHALANPDLATVVVGGAWRSSTRRWPRSRWGRCPRRRWPRPSSPT